MAPGQIETPFPILGLRDGTLSSPVSDCPSSASYPFYSFKEAVVLGMWPESSFVLLPQSQLLLLLQWAPPGK